MMRSMFSVTQVGWKAPCETAVAYSTAVLEAMTSRSRSWVARSAVSARLRSRRSAASRSSRSTAGSRRLRRQTTRRRWQRLARAKALSGS